MYCELPIWGVKSRDSDDVYCSNVSYHEAEQQWKKYFRQDKSVVFTKRNIDKEDLRLRKGESRVDGVRSVSSDKREVTGAVRLGCIDPLSLL